VIVNGENPSPKPSSFVPTEYHVQKDGITDTSRFPVEQVSHTDCEKFIDRLNDAVKNGSIKLPAAFASGKFCLPHENEWEYAARGGRGNKQAFYFGNELNGVLANCNGPYPFGRLAKGPYLQRTTDVGSYENKELNGVKAKHPWNLCDMAGNVNQWCENKYDYENEAFSLRGGSWNGTSWNCRSARRVGLTPPFQDIRGVGVRVCFRLD
jgi:formylglycine-generating enzyme